MENKKITISLPFADLLNSYSILKQKIQNTFILFQEAGANASFATKRVFGSSLSTMNRGFKRNFKKLLMVVVPLILVVILVTVVVQALKPRQNGTNTSAVLASNKIYTKSSQPINKEFTFDLKDEAGKSVGKFSFIVQKAELTNEIIWKGERGKAVEGREFLLVYLKIVNNNKDGFNLQTRNYVRLFVNGNKEEKLAPELHNDPVEVQAISTKYTRVGFTINTDDRDPVLVVGDIDGKKQEIPLQF